MARDRQIPHISDGSALEGGAESGNDTQNYTQNAKKQMAGTPCPRCVLHREETAVEKQDGELDEDECE